MIFNKTGVKLLTREPTDSPVDSPVDSALARTRDMPLLTYTNRFGFRYRADRRCLGRCT